MGRKGEDDVVGKDVAGAEFGMGETVELECFGSA